MNENAEAAGRTAGNAAIVNAGFHRKLSRRAFVAGAAGLGLLAGCGRWPWPAQAPRVARIGYLAGDSPDSPFALARLGAFRDGLREYGYVEGENIVLEYRFTDVSSGDPAALFEHAAELARLPVDVIVTAGPPTIAAAKQATITIPIVMATGDDPVRLGLVTSLARPGGNVTGLTSFSTHLAGKRLELLKEVSAELPRVAVLWEPNDPSHASQVSDWESAARALALELRPLEVRQPDDIGNALDAAIRERANALVALQSAFTFSHREQILQFAMARRLTTAATNRSWVDVGGLMYYGPNVLENYRRAAYYVDRILQGANPADLPIEQPMRFDFVVNLKTAQALGITFPPEILLQVTEVVQ
jgi:putative tryptophan/tyrosine transport system substrate-binding protein